MPKIHETWTVMPHGEVTEIDDGIWTVVGQLDMPLTPRERRMSIVRLRNGELIIYSAIALDEARMGHLEAAGRMAYLIVPGDHHRLDAKIWKERYPALQVIAPISARKAVEQIVSVDATYIDFNDEAVAFVTVAGTSGHEAALLVRRPTGTTLIVNDIIGNMPKDSGLVLRLTQFAGDEPHVPLPVRFGLQHKAGLRDQLLAWAEEPRLKRILMSHGAPLDTAPADELRRLASTLT